MKKLPEEVIAAWGKRNKIVVLTTVDSKGVPNSIYATCADMYEGGKIVIADNYFNKTKANILSGSSGTVLFITEDNKAYQVKGTLEFHRDGAMFDFMKCWNPEKHPGHAAAVLTPNAVFSGAKKLA